MPAPGETQGSHTAFTVPRVRLLLSPRSPCSPRGQIHASSPVLAAGETTGTGLGPGGDRRTRLCLQTTQQDAVRRSHVPFKGDLGEELPLSRTCLATSLGALLWATERVLSEDGLLFCGSKCCGSKRIFAGLMTSVRWAEFSITFHKPNPFSDKKICQH